MNSPVYKLFLKHVLLSVPLEFYIRVATVADILPLPVLTYFCAPA